MAKKDIIKSIAPILDTLTSNRKELSKIADDLDELFAGSEQNTKDAERINNLFAAVACLKEAENFISQI